MRFISPLEWSPWPQSVTLGSGGAEDARTQVAVLDHAVIDERDRSRYSAQIAGAHSGLGYSAQNVDLGMAVARMCGRDGAGAV